MEGSHVLKSLDLLKLRRSRMSRNSSGTVEKNQSLVIEMPNMMARLIQMLRIINYGPNLSELISHNIVVQFPVTSDILNFLPNRRGLSDWDHFSNLEARIGSSRSSNSNNSNRSNSNDQTVQQTSPITPANPIVSSNRGSATVPPRPTGTVRVPLEFSTPQNRHSTSSHSVEVEDEDDDIMDELLSAFSPLRQNDNNTNDNGDGNFQSFELTNILSVIQLAQSLGIADLTPLGESLFTTAQPNMRPYLTRRTSPSMIHSSSRDTPAHCRKELQFHAMLLAPHQIELIFVLCTLLSGRRKISVQKTFADLGLAKILRDMYDRMSWDAPPYVGDNFEHIHGPGCECNPESTVRVQFLRLIHNFFDRDFLGNENKLLILSEKERELILNSQSGDDIRDGIAKLQSNERGTLSLIIRTLIREPSEESLYRFWLSACVDNFMRGCGRMGQLFVAHSGMLQHATQHIVKSIPSASNPLQIAFDFLSEMVKCNKTVLEMLEESLNDNEFRHFVRIIMDNLVDSNVFIRSLYFSLEMISFAENIEGDFVHGMSTFGFFANSMHFPESLRLESVRASDSKPSVVNVGFLTDSWIQFTPAVQSTRALDLYKIEVDTHAAEATARELKLHQLREANNNVKKKDSKSLFDLDNVSYRCNLDFHEDINRFVQPPLAQSQPLPSSPLNLQQQQQEQHSQQLDKNTLPSTIDPTFNIDHIPTSITSFKPSDNLLSVDTFGDLSQLRDTFSTSSPTFINDDLLHAPPNSSTKTSASKNGAGALSSLSRGMMETLKDIRKATDNLLKFSSKSNSPQPQSSTNDGRKFSNNPIKLHKLAAASATAAATVIPPSAPACLSSDAVSDTDAEEWMVFETPPEEPKFQRVAVTAARKSSPNRSCESSSSDDFELHSPERVAETVDVDSVQSVGDTNTPPEFPTVFSSLNTVDASESIDSMDNDVAKDEYLLSNPISQSSMSDYSLLEETLVNHEPLLTHAESKENKENTLSHVDIVKTSSSSGFIIPNSLFRISLFLKQEKANILLRLFGTVTLRTINHESICCLNTLLLILLFENKRGQLPQILNKVRELANIEFESVADQPSHEGKDVNEDQDDEGLW
eukprot:CAMPEP_0170102268 /NCGR_PEP_ID=MMETSP0020_2-20130122/2779_1 /TAXON_ID=98059 /ORGANISM="Dinobryon sp., Strain UTEXLB2267" /LENGTH=1097 /DNA_ID=CAMNT_0010325575 /DNA_START=613 /DNA_END=3904 /DNA_ORIENTATION=-